jgi:hypothetical protein
MSRPRAIRLALTSLATLATLALLGCGARRELVEPDDFTPDFAWYRLNEFQDGSA